VSRDKKTVILKDVLGSYRRSGDEMLFYCPKCKHHKRKLSINLEKDVFKCWVCDYRANSVYRLIRKYGTFLQKSEWEELDGKVELSQSFYDKLFGSTEEEEEKTIDLPKEYISLANKTLPITAASPLNYLKSRGVGRQDIVRWKIGYCRAGEYSNRIIIPSFNKDGHVNCFVARSYGDDWMKYKMPEGISKDIIFNELYVDWKNDLTITEGCFDAIKAGNAVPLLGSTLREDSRLFQEIVKHDTPIYVALDPDAEKKAKRLISALLQYDVELYKVDISGYNDVGEMSKDEFNKRKKGAISMNSSSYLKYEIQGIL
jgi:DNA primase